MVLSFFILDQLKHQKAGEKFVSLVNLRYTDRLVDILRLDGRRTFYRIKSFQAGIIPYLLLDFAIQARGIPCQIVFANDLTEFQNLATATPPPASGSHDRFPEPASQAHL